MHEVIQEEHKPESPESCQQEDLLKRAEELTECAEEITALVMQLPVDVLATTEGGDFFESASTLVASLQNKVSIITKETGSKV